MHVAAGPGHLDDVDAINFTLGVRDFDVAKHQPHPPGYPVLIAAAKIVAGTAHALGGLGGMVPASVDRGAGRDRGALAAGDDRRRAA